MTMDQFVALGLGIVLLLITLRIALSFLAGPMSFLRKTGVTRGFRWMLRSLWRGAAGSLRLLVRGRRARVRRPSSRPAFRNFRSAI